MNTKLHAGTNREGRPVSLFLTAGLVGDDKGALALQGGFPKADWLLADRSYDADWFGKTLSDRKIRASIPPRKSRTTPIKYDKRRYRRRRRIEIMFGLTCPPRNP